MQSGDWKVAVAFSGVWNLVTAYFVARASARTVYAMGGTPPGWLPQPTVTTVGVDGALVFIWFIGTALVAMGLCLAYLSLIWLFGRVEVTVRGGEASVFTGVGPAGLRKRFDVDAVKSVTIGRSRWEPDDEHLPEIVVEADREVRLGSMLSPPRMNWMAAVLAETLVRR